MENKKQKNKEMKKTIMLTSVIFITIILSLAVFANQCNDGADNDLDGKIDYPSDNGCSSPTDSSESMVYGYFDGCLAQGDRLQNVFGQITYECDTTFCSVCVLMTEAGNYTTNPSKCYSSSKCSFSGGGGTINIDSTPPVLIVNSPENNQIFDSRAVLFDLEFNEPSSIYYIDNLDNRGQWKKLCSNCQSSYTHAISFKEGLNNISIKAVDSNNNAVEIIKVFRVDSQNPKIKNAEPKSGFASGEFKVEFVEENPMTLRLYYGLNGALQTSNINIANSCDNDNGLYSCVANVNLNQYNGQGIQYYFELTDIAGNTASSKPINLDVDSLVPIITNIDYPIDGKDVYFSISVNEAYLDEVGYFYLDNSGKTKQKSLCTKLVNGICDKKVSFKDGEQLITIYALDKAGQLTGVDISFFIDSKNPKIKKTEPKKGYADGDFSLEFEEENPKTVTLFYGLIGSEKQVQLNINSDCALNKYYTCQKSVNLAEFNGKEINYYFKVEDIKGNIVESKAVDLDVDTTFPVMNNPLSFWVQGDGKNNKYIYFEFDITEVNFDELSYMDYSENNPKWKSLCTKLVNGICEKKKSFTKGHHLIDFQIIDEAGNAISAPQIDFTVV